MNHYHAVLLRIGAGIFMWAYALIAYKLNVLKLNNIVGISTAVLFLTLMNPILLWGVRHLKNHRALNLFSLFTNIVEIMVYTVIIYFLGGIRALWFSPIYVVAINYIGFTGSKKTPFIIAAICAVMVAFMAAMEYTGFIPSQDPFPNTPMPMKIQATLIITIACYLQIVAFVSAYSGNLLRVNSVID